jgi:hypothetical protein
MAMFRRSRTSTPALRRRQQEIARQEAELRAKLESLERIVTRGPAKARENPPAQRAAQEAKDRRFRVSLAPDEKRGPGKNRSARRPRLLRKERREGQIIFLVLLTAFGALVAWLISHLHP